jgi:uncharacterized protein (TIGR02266 family)
MSYSGADVARSAREQLGKALAGLQEDPNTPPDVMSVAQNIAQAVGALFDAEKAADERTGKLSIRNALGSLSQTMALLQDVKSEHQGVGSATATIAGAMSRLHPLTVVPSMVPGAPSRPSMAPRPQSSPPQIAPGPRQEVEANLGASSETNFYVGFSGEIAEGGVFVATYNTLDVGTLVHVMVNLPGGYEFKLPGRVHFVRDPMDMSAEAEPGMGVKFEALPADNRELILRFIRKRAPMFYDD